MRYKFQVMLVLLVCMVLGMLAVGSSMAAGKYVLAYIREMGQNEIGPWGESHHRLKVRVWDENGNPVVAAEPNHTTPGQGGAGWGTTNSFGLFDINSAGGSEMPDLTTITMSAVTPGVPPNPGVNTNDPASDISPIMGAFRTWFGTGAVDNPLTWGSGYEIGYLYKASDTNPGNFFPTTGGWDPANPGNFVGTWWVPPTPSWNNDAPPAGWILDASKRQAPYTTSLAYNSINYTLVGSDANNSSSNLGYGPGASFGQTFVATGKRVVAISVKTILDGSNKYPLNCQVYDAVGGNPVSPVKRVDQVDSQFPTSTIFTFGINECKVTAGNTYYYKVWTDNASIQAYLTTANVYANGQAYQSDAALTGKDLFGYVVCMGDDSTNLLPNACKITGTVKNSLGTNLVGAKVSYKTGGVTKVAYTDASGVYTFWGVPQGMYVLTAESLGNCPVALLAKPKNDGVTVTLNFTLGNAAANLVQNGGFEDATPLNYWTNLPATGDLAVYNTVPADAKSGSAWAGKYDNSIPPQYGNKSPMEGTMYQVVSGINPAKTYTVGAWMRTNYYYGGTAWGSNYFSGVYPNANWCKLELDFQGRSASGLTGGNSGTYHNNAAWVTTPEYPFLNWRFVSYSVDGADVPTGSLGLYLSYHIGGFGNYVGWAMFDDVSVYEKCATPISPLTIADLLTLPDGSEANISSQLVTADYDALLENAFYVEDINRIAGIRIVSDNTQPYIGETWDIEGTMGTDADGERVINASNITGPVATGQTLPEALFEINKDLGGTNLNVDTLGVYNGKGLYNVGKLVRVAGKITGTSTNCFYIDDGSGLNDGNTLGASGAVLKGVRIDTTGLAVNTSGKTFAVVTGIATKTTIGANKVRMVRPINATVTYIKLY